MAFSKGHKLKSKYSKSYKKYHDHKFLESNQENQVKNEGRGFLKYKSSINKRLFQKKKTHKVIN